MKKKILKDFELTEISGVDRPAQPTAKMTIMKRADDPAAEFITKYYYDNPEVKDFKAILENNKKQKKIWEAREDLYPLLNALSDSVSAIAANLDYSNQERQSKIQLSVNDFMEAVRDVLPDIEEELQKMFEGFYQAGSSGINPDGEKMSEDVTKKLAEIEKSLADKTTELEKAYKDMAEMKAMDEKKKKEAEMKKNDETIEVSGQTISKSAVGDATFAVFKSQAESIAKAEERIAKAEEAAELALLEKRAATEFAHVPGTAADHAKVLKAIKAMPEDVAKQVEAIMKVAEETNAKAFETVGVSKVSAEVRSAEEKLEKVAEEIRKSAPTMTKEQAIVKAYEMNPELVKELV